MEILIENLEFSAIIGILDFERQKEQKLRLCGKFWVDFGDLDSIENLNNAKSTNSENTAFLDYSKLREFFLREFKERKFLLLENALLYFKNALPREFPMLLSYEISIYKLEIFSDCAVGVRDFWQKGK